MSITASSLYRDTGNFFRHQLVTILLMALLTAFISVMIAQALSPASDQLAQLSNGDFTGMNLVQVLQNMPPEQKAVLWRLIAAGGVAALIGNALLVGGMLSLIPLVSAGERTSALRAIGQSAPLLPRLVLLSFLMALISYLGFMVLIVPGVLLMLLLSFSPVILAEEKAGVVAAMRRSVSLTWRNMKLVAPAVLVWMLAKVLLLVASPSLAALPENLASVLLNALSNLISALLIIYLYRLYMLLR